MHFSEVKYIEKVIKTPERENKSLITEQQWVSLAYLSTAWIEVKSQ